MDMWRIPVMGLLKQGLNRDYDRLHDLVNQHSDIRRFPGHAVIGDNYRYNYQTIKDNVSLLKPKLLEEVNQSVVESGHKISGKSLTRFCAGAVAHLSLKPMIIPQNNLLWDALYAREVGPAALAHCRGWCQCGSPQEAVQNGSQNPACHSISCQPVLPSAISLYAA